MAKDRLNQDQQMALLDVAGIMTLMHGKTIKHIEPYLEKIPRGMADYKLMRTKSEKLFEKLCEVVPAESLRKLIPTLKRISLRIGVPLIGQENDCDSEFGMVVSWEDLNAIVAGCKDKCRLCDIPDAKIKDCALRRALRNLPTPDEPEPIAGGCGFKRLMIETED